MLTAPILIISGVTLYYCLKNIEFLSSNEHANTKTPFPIFSHARFSAPLVFAFAAFIISVDIITLPLTKPAATSTDKIAPSVIAVKPIPVPIVCIESQFPAGEKF